MRTTSGSATRSAEAIRAELTARLQRLPGAGPRLRAEVDGGRADLYLEPADAHATHEVLTTAAVVPGVTSVHLYCGQAHR
jgi:hypothetical protein